MHVYGEETAGEAGLLGGFAEGGGVPGFVEVEAPFGEEVLVCLEVVEGADLVGGEVEED